MLIILDSEPFAIIGTVLGICRQLTNRPKEHICKEH